MGALSGKLRDLEGNGLMFMCPGCNDRHSIYHGDGPGPRWAWNGNAEKPTFTPSVLVTREAVPNAPDDMAEWRTERRCHSFVTDGQIQFLSDCTHHLAGQTVDLPNWTRGVE
jgi:hypothetical protein